MFSNRTLDNFKSNELLLEVKQPTLTGVGLGPGDPEMITLKALRALNSADIIFYPATYSDDGQVQSWSLKILEQLEISTGCRPLVIPMTDKNREVNYQKAYGAIREELDKGKKVVVVNEGDVLFYSTFGYLLKLAKADGIQCEVISGVPAFIAAGSTGQCPIVEGSSGFNLIARPKSFEQITEMLQSGPGDTLVVMKMKVIHDWYGFLKQNQCRFLYVEKAGTPEQFATSDAEELREREIPYFSLIIFYRGEKD